ncbi:hypothetical protein M2138_001895 [Dysgonomonadaceae bacterium PH5-43]|nr:hypothetical protein [Dysgonomonadaceae bacterium PH5-43]
MKILFLKHKDIDKVKYDEAINKSLNGTVYALSWYLDVVSPNWKLLATENYSYVMPLPCKTKFGLTYVLQPLMCQQLGLFSSLEINKGILSSFLKKVPALYCEMYLNCANVFDDGLNLRDNYILDLNKSYEEIKSNYKKSTRSRLNQIPTNRLQIDKQLDSSVFFDFVENNSPYYKGKVFNIMKAILKEADIRSKSILWGVKEMDTDELLAAAAFLRWNKCIYYVVAVATDRGRKLQAPRYLLDRFFYEYSDNDIVFDFEGSTIASVAEFYKSFGAKLSPYTVFKKKIFL